MVFDYDIKLLSFTLCELIFIIKLVDGVVKLFFHCKLAFFKSGKLSAYLFTLGSLHAFFHTELGVFCVAVGMFLRQTGNLLSGGVCVGMQCFNL